MNIRDQFPEMKEPCQGGMEFAHWVHRRGEKTYQFVVDNADDPMQICDYFARLAQEFAQDKINAGE